MKDCRDSDTPGSELRIDNVSCSDLESVSSDDVPDIFSKIVLVRSQSQILDQLLHLQNCNPFLIDNNIFLWMMRING